MEEKNTCPACSYAEEDKKFYKTYRVITIYGYRYVELVCPVCRVIFVSPQRIGQ